MMSHLRAALFALIALFVMLVGHTSMVAAATENLMMSDPMLGGLDFGVGIVDEGLNLTPRVSLNMGVTEHIFPIESINFGVALGVDFGFIADSFVRPANSTEFQAYDFETAWPFDDSEERNELGTSGPWATVHANVGLVARVETFGRPILWSLGVSGTKVQNTTHVEQGTDGVYRWRRMQYPWAGAYLLPGLYAQTATELFWGLTQLTVSATESIRWEERALVIEYGALVPTGAYAEHSDRQWRVLLSVFPRALN